MSADSAHADTIAPGALIGLTGATGFVGRNLTRALVETGYRVRALVRNAQKALRVLPKAGVELVEGDVLSQATLGEFIAGCDAAIHLIGIIEERPGKGVTFQRLHVDATRNIVEAAQYAGLSRYLHMSALGARAEAPSSYHRSKFEAERIVRASGLKWTIFQPSLIVGPQGEFTRMMRAWARGEQPPYVVLPYFGNGLLGLGRESRVQPVAVADVAVSFVAALSQPVSVGQSYGIGGPETMTWPQMLGRVRDLTDGSARWRRPTPIPAWFAWTVARAAESLRLGAALPFNSAQVTMSREDVICDIVPIRRDLGVEPRPLEAALAGGPPAA